MRCPKCGSRIKKEDTACSKCGLKISDLKNASFQQTTKAKAEFQPEKIIYSSFFPYDISYKKTLLLCVFLGWMGAHCYFVKRYFKAISMSVMMFIFLLTIISMVTVLEKVETFLAPLGSWLLISGNYIIPCVMGALCVIMWISDIIKISFKKFKVPVVLQEK